MKELKAKALLKEYQEIHLNDLAIANDYALKSPVAQQYVDKIDEALAELQELTQEKGCEECQHLNEQGMCELCAPCKRYIQDHYTPKG